MSEIKAVALGGGHGLQATLGALRRITPDVTAVVTVADDGGSSGRLRRDFGLLPPGDLRKALTALAGDGTDDWAGVMEHRFGALIFSIAILFGTVFLFKMVPTGFIPTQDTGQIVATTEAAQGTSFPEMVKKQQQVAAIVAQDPNISVFMSSVGGGGGAGATLGAGGNADAANASIDVLLGGSVDITGSYTGDEGDFSGTLAVNASALASGFSQ